MIEFPDFSDIRNPTLRNWNRLNVIINMKELNNNRLSVNYAKRFSRKDKIVINKLIYQIKTTSYEEVRRSIIRNNNG